MKCKINERYELTGAKSGSYSGSARSYAVNRLTPHYRTADKPFYAMEAAQPYHLIKADRMSYQDSKLAPARTYTGEITPHAQNRIKQYFEQPKINYIEQPAPIKARPWYKPIQTIDVKPYNKKKEYSQKEDEIPLPTKPLKPNKRYLQQTPEMIYARNLPQIKPQYVPNTLHHRYGVLPVEISSSDKYASLERRTQTCQKQNRKEQEKLEQTLKRPTGMQKPVFEIRKGWDEHSQKEVPIVYIFEGSELETKLMKRYGEQPRDFSYAEIHYMQGRIYGDLKGTAIKKVEGKGCSDAIEEAKDLVNAYFNQLMIMKALITPEFNNRIQLVNSGEYKKGKYITEIDFLSYRTKDILETKTCKNCNIPTDEDICENCGMVQN